MAKNTLYYKGKYYQGSLSNERAQTILTLLSEYTSVSSLRHVITDAPQHVITDIKNDAENYEKEHGSLKGFSKDYSKETGIGTLRDAQTMGVAFMYYAKSAILGDEVGLGKTVQIAGLSNVLRKDFANKGKKFRLLFLAEKSTAGQIRDKLIQFTGEYVGLIESGEKRIVDKYIEANKEERYYSVVGTHALLDNPLFLTEAAKNPFDLVIVDESSVVKNTSSNYHKGCKSLFKYHKRKILLNATPIETNVREMYNQLDLVDPDFLPTLTDFNKQFAKFKRGRFGWGIDGYKNGDVFKEAVSLRYLARTREELGANYENNFYKTILVPLSKEQKALNKITQLKQMLVDFPTGVDRRVPYNDETTPKLAVLKIILEEKVDIFHTQAVIYCHHKQAQKQMEEILEDIGYRCVVLNGESSAKVRTQTVNDFNNGQYDVMITNVLKGIDLDTCDTCILYSISPNPQHMVQFEGRITRDFNIENKSVYLLVAMGKEKKFVESTLKLRVTTSASFSKNGKSMVIQAISSDENKEMYDASMYDDE